MKARTVATSFNKDDKSARRAVADDIRRQQANKERRTTLSVIGASALVFLLIVGAAAYRPIMDWWDLRKFNDVDLATIGAPATVCQAETTKDAGKAGDHVPAGTPIVYNDAPPAFGQHYDSPAPMERKLYSAADRPALGTLVHNQEHGYTILWFDTTIADDADQMTLISAIADKMQGTGNQRLKFKAVPWLATDENGKAFPEGQHIALTHWSNGGVGDAATDKPVGVWQYCSEVSGQALTDFMLKYPYLDSPEPNAA